MPRSLTGIPRRASPGHPTPRCRAGKEARYHRSAFAVEPADAARRACYPCVLVEPACPTESRDVKATAPSDVEGARLAGVAETVALGCVRIAACRRAALAGAARGDRRAVSPVAAREIGRASCRERV